MRPDVVDHAAVFDALPTPYLVVTPELQIVGVNRAYLQATGRRAADLLGLPLFDAFPDDPDDPTARATDRLRQSLVRALRTGRPDTMPVQRYNIPSAEGFERRWWSPVNVPVLDRDGRVSLLVHRVEDVTPVIADLIERDEVSDPDAVTLPAQAPPLVDLYLRGHELRDALTEESVAAATRSRVLLPTRETSLAWSAEMPDIVASTGLVAWASLPLEVGPKVLGSLTVGWRVAQHFDERDVQLLDAFAALLAQALHRIRRAERDRERLAAERALMTELQLSLLTEPVQPEGLEVAVRYRPSSRHARIGGDWYDAFRSGPDHLDVVIGDVTGHDREAAATMAQLRTLVRGVSATLRSSPGAVLEAVEQAMSRLELDTFATAVVAQVRLEADADGSRRVRWSSAGHLPPVVLHPDGGVEPLRAPPQLLLGLSPTTRRRDHEVALRPGESLVLYTDGLVESRASSARDGIERLLQTLDDRPGLSAQEVCDLLLEAQERQEDDVALLVLRALP